MRILISGVVMFLVMMLLVTLARDTLFRPPAEAELELTELGSDTPREALEDGLSGLAFECTGDERGLKEGERACFAPVSRVGDYEADYLALFLDADRELAAVNVVLDPERHAANRRRMREALGEPTREMAKGRTWLVWERGEHLILTHKEPAEAADAPVLMWFRDAGLMERLLPQP